MQSNKINICIQGLGFVGAAMLANLSTIKNKKNKYIYNIKGIDTCSKEGKRRIDSINKGKFPFETSDKKLIDAISRAFISDRIFATDDIKEYSNADIIIIDINFDVDEFVNGIKQSSFMAGIKQIANHMKPDAFILIETTVPPGTSEEIIIPEIKKILKKRKLNNEDFLFAHSYERVMPGVKYFDSIRNYWRVYAGMNKNSSEKCKNFLKKFIDTKNFPLTELSSIRASELAKIMENTYRAVTISLMDEWGKYSEKIGVDLYEVTDAIKKRPSHSNIRVPGLGVGGYCLTKDPIFGKISAEKIYNLTNFNFPVSSLALKVNSEMPNHAAEILFKKYSSSLKTKKILLLGVSYIAEVGDTRHSPSSTLFKRLINNVNKIDCHDPYVTYWDDLNIKILEELPKFSNYDIIVLAVAHKFYLNLDFPSLMPKNGKTLLFDTNGILSKLKVNEIKKMKIPLITVGR
jgi:nucleotide sugar dehydrogenase